MKEKKITLYGAGGHSYAAVALIKSLGEFEPIVVLDDDPKQKMILNVPVKKNINEKLSTNSLCISVGTNKNRKKIAAKFDVDFPSFLHDSVVKYPSVKIGKGTLVLPNVVLDADVTIGDFCIVNNNATVSHNVVVEKFVHIAIQVAIAGGVTIGEGTFIGAGSVVLPEINIGKWAIIGAGAIITKDVPDYAVVYGNPGKIIRYNQENEF